MEPDRGSWFPQRHFDWQLPNLNSLSTRLDLGQQQNNFSASINRCSNMVIPNGTLPASAFSELPQLPAGNANEPHGWFYSLPQFRQAFTPMPHPIFKENLRVGPHGNNEAAELNSGSRCAQKSFLVFDQTGDQTTLIFNSGIGAPVQCQTSWNPKLPSAYNSNGNEPGTKREPIYHPGQILRDALVEDHGTDVESDMHEDTEELNALLYSDDDSDQTEDDEVTSTGHTPSTMTFHDKQDWLEGSGEEVASSDEATKRPKQSAEEVASADEATKRPKQFERGCDVLSSLVDTASSAKRKRPQSLEYEDEAQSSCANVKYPSSDEIDFFSGNKRMKREKIRETVSILQRIIPGGKGKDAIDVLDEAIHYLKSLKHKAETLGLDSI